MFFSGFSRLLKVQGFGRVVGRRGGAGGDVGRRGVVVGHFPTHELVNGHRHLGEQVVVDAPLFSRQNGSHLQTIQEEALCKLFIIRIAMHSNKKDQRRSLTSVSAFEPIIKRTLHSTRKQSKPELA